MQLVSQRHRNTSCRPIAQCNISFLCYATELFCSRNSYLKWNSVLLFATIASIFIESLHRVISIFATCNATVRLAQAQFKDFKRSLRIRGLSRCKMQRSLLRVTHFTNTFCNGVATQVAKKLPRVTLAIGFGCNYLENSS